MLYHRRKIEVKIFWVETTKRWETTIAIVIIILAKIVAWNMKPFLLSKGCHVYVQNVEPTIHQSLKYVEITLLFVCKFDFFSVFLCVTVCNWKGFVLKGNTR